MVIEAKYGNGVIRPLGKVKLKEGTLVEIHVDRQEPHRRAQSIRELGFAGMWPTAQISKMASVTSRV